MSEPTAIDDVERLMSRRDVERATTLSKSELYRRVRDGRFPAPIKVGTHRVAWRRSEIAAWIDGCAARDTAAPAS